MCTLLYAYMKNDGSMNTIQILINYYIHQSTYYVCEYQRQNIMQHTLCDVNV